MAQSAADLAWRKANQPYVKANLKEAFLSWYFLLPFGLVAMQFLWLFPLTYLWLWSMIVWPVGFWPWAGIVGLLAFFVVSQLLTWRSVVSIKRARADAKRRFLEAGGDLGHAVEGFRARTGPFRAISWLVWGLLAMRLAIPPAVALSLWSITPSFDYVSRKTHRHVHVSQESMMRKILRRYKREEIFRIVW